MLPTEAGVELLELLQTFNEIKDTIGLVIIYFLYFNFF